MALTAARISSPEPRLCVGARGRSGLGHLPRKPSQGAGVAGTQESRCQPGDEMGLWVKTQEKGPAPFPPGSRLPFT